MFQRLLVSCGFVGLVLAGSGAYADLADGAYTIEVSHSGKCLDVAGGQDGASVKQMTCNEKDNQIWDVTHEGSGTYLLKPRHSGKCLDIAVDPARPNEGASKANFADVIQWACHAGPMQSWQLTQVEGSASTFTVKSAFSGKCLDISGHSKEESANLHKYECHGRDNQQFTFIPMVEASTAAAEFQVVEGDYTCPGGWRPATLDEVNANAAAARSTPGLGAWHIARLACGGSQDGSGNEFRNRAEDARELGHTLCIKSSQPEFCEGRGISAKVHEHCSADSQFTEYTQVEHAQMNWPNGWNLPSYVTLAENTGMTVYSETGFAGQSLAVLKSSNLCELKYPDGTAVNDRVKSLKIYYVPK